MYLSIIKVEPLDNYLLKLTFENNEERIFDIKPFLNKGKFNELTDIKMFKSVHINFDTVEWNNNLDLDPESLYELSKPA
jgi:hypothetical protein